jgi:hypothetical protein
MVTGRFVRMRWRLRGAWMWPTFVALTLLDGAIVSWFPLAGDSESPVGGWLLGLFLSLLGIILVAPLLARGLRRYRRDMPPVVARDYAGTAVVVTVTVMLLVIGLAHRQAIASDQRALQDAIARAQAFIGDRAPLQFQFQRTLSNVDTLPIQPPDIYRVCVRNRQRTTDYCVIVNRSEPFGSSVKFSGSEPNSLLGQGA